MKSALALLLAATVMFALVEGRELREVSTSNINLTLNFTLPPLSTLDSKSCPKELRSMLVPSRAQRSTVHSGQVCVGRDVVRVH